MEEKMGFVESAVHSRFFREGKFKQWEALLSANQIDTIQKNYKYLCNILVIYRNRFTIIYKELNTKYA